MKRKILSFILITTFLTGCNTHSIESQPEGKVVVDNKDYTMIGSDYSWKGNNIEINTKSSPDIYELADQFKTLEVKKGDTLKLEIERNPSSIKAIKLNEDGTSDYVEIKDNKITMPSDEGYYIYKLKTTWDKGKETFIFDVNIK
ncbi:lipoprotein [Rummeliibacillus sp. NPDC094406]|uniref:lipoprotein n=1 Tax=Rummeliibacillus sp. NPDC094406 TaxID=3364511 RepID=UPI00381EA8F9